MNSITVDDLSLTQSQLKNLLFTYEKYTELFHELGIYTEDQIRVLTRSEAKTILKNLFTEINKF